MRLNFIRKDKSDDGLMDSDRIKWERRETTGEANSIDVETGYDVINYYKWTKKRIRNIADTRLVRVIIMFCIKRCYTPIHNTDTSNRPCHINESKMKFNKHNRLVDLRIANRTFGTRHMNTSKTWKTSKIVSHAYLVARDWQVRYAFVWSS
mgnify:CR=1 FL=1